MISADALDRAADLLARARTAIAFTGAGVSVESGIPHFRGEGGLWTKFDPYKVAHIETFRRDPAQYWTYSLNHRRADAEPNPAHRALAELQRDGRLGPVITQNTDGLHQKAGTRDVIELHGSSMAVVCLDCDARFPRAEVDSINRRSCPPPCPSCGGRFLKPTVVLFGEPLPVEALDHAHDVARRTDLVLVIGSSMQVYPAAGIPRLALQGGADLCIVNAEPTPLDEVARVVIHGKAGDVLPAIARRVAISSRRSR
ncbi:MAG: NAD-dependent deacylase [Candidatus Dormibacteraeota bacterium]|nr:NAD-dependent deacylase [Candidatus Dormibacteraeota bacterium]